MDCYGGFVLTSRDSISSRTNFGHFSVTIHYLESGPTRKETYNQPRSNQHPGRSFTIHHETQRCRTIWLASENMGAYFRITLMRSAIGLPKKTSGVLQALGLRKRLRTVYHPVSPQVAGQIFAVKELVDVQEVDRALTKAEINELRRPDPGFYIETTAVQQRAKS